MPKKAPIQIGTETQQALGDSSGHFTGMWVGSTKAMITGGDSFTLSAAPFMEENTVYIPLIDVAALFGGTVIHESGGGSTIAYDETAQGPRIK